MAGSEVDQAAGNEEGRNTPRALGVQRDSGLDDPADTADSRSDQDAGAPAFLVGLRLPPGIGHGLVCGGYRIDNEIVDLALLLGLHREVWIEGPVGAVAARYAAGDLTWEV